MPRYFLSCIIALSLLLVPAVLRAEQINVAVASNFTSTLRPIVDNFESSSGHNVVIISGSTGKHYAQILQGAPYDIFLAADTERPAKLEQMGKGHDRFTYATGRLVLWNPGGLLLTEESFFPPPDSYRFLAIANPELAPYGLAARQVMEYHDAWEGNQQQIVQGENINQAYQFVQSRNAQLGLVSLSQIISQQVPEQDFRLAPANWHTEIRQQAIRLTEGEAASEFMQFLRSQTAIKLIQDAGYSPAQ